ncbi:hypothetical protein CF095_09390 [Clostridium botulinum]
MTSKGITKQELNNDILQELNKIDKQFAEDTTKELTEIKETNKKQQIDIDKMMSSLTFMTCQRGDKQGGYYKHIAWKRKDDSIYARSVLAGNGFNESFKPTMSTLSFYEKGNSSPIETYMFDLIFDDDSGDLIEMRLR